MERDVVVIIGAGGMGLAIARRIGSGARVLVADADAVVLETAREQLADEGYEVVAAAVDVSSRASVTALAAQAAALGSVRSVVHTAGLSPVQASVEAILAVDLLGVALVLEEFAGVISPGGAGLVIASMAGHFQPPLPPDEARRLATAPADELLSLPVVSPATITDPGAAYSIAKRANHLRVQAASTTWGAKGARINSISPGVISTAMGREELRGGNGAAMRLMIDASNAKRTGTPADIAAAAAFLLSPAAGFVSGTDLLVDGGAVAAIETGALG